jgi:hypothetical protein
MFLTLFLSEYTVNKNTQGNLKMWPYWTVFRYMQVKLYAIFLRRKIKLPFIDRDLLYRDPQQYISYIMELSFTGGGRQSIGGKPPNCHMSLTNFMTSCSIEYSSTWAGFELTTFAVIGTDCTCSCKSNYHAIMTTKEYLFIIQCITLQVVCFLHTSK